MLVMSNGSLVIYVIVCNYRVLGISINKNKKHDMMNYRSPVYSSKSHQATAWLSSENTHWISRSTEALSIWCPLILYLIRKFEIRPVIRIHNLQWVFAQLPKHVWTISHANGFPWGSRPMRDIAMWKSAWKSNFGTGQACDVEKWTSSQMKSKRLGWTDRQTLLMTRSSGARATWITAFTASADRFPRCGSFKSQASVIHGAIWMQKRSERSAPVFSGFYKVDELLIQRLSH